LEFASVVDAARCAVEVQRGMAERNTDVPQHKRIEFRIGIHVGDIIIADDDIFGDGVNIAVRLEGIAEPGGICVSARVHEYAQGQHDIDFEDAGEQQLKNLAQLVRVYKLRLGDVDLSSTAPLTAPPGRHGRPRLSIVVLPFANLGGDKEQNDFVDAITENLTTDLSRLPDFFVVACKTAFTYKGKAVDARQVGRELGVRYVLEGSVQSGTDRLRVNAQLIDAESGAHLWAERFDKPRMDLFDMQDEITARLARAMDLELVAVDGVCDARCRRNWIRSTSPCEGTRFSFRNYQLAEHAKHVAYLRKRSASTTTTLMRFSVWSRPTCGKSTPTCPMRVPSKFVWPRPQCPKRWS
jgi:TolB-like protein